MNDLRIIKRRSRFGVSLTLTTTDTRNAPHQIKLGVLSCNNQQARLLEDMLVAGGAHTMPRVAVESGDPIAMRKERVPSFGKV